MMKVSALLLSVLVCLQHVSTSAEVVGLPGICDDGQQMIMFSETEVECINEDEIFHLAAERVAFMDVSDHPDLSLGEIEPIDAAIPSQPSKEPLVRSLSQDVSIDTVVDTITLLSAFYTRYYTQQTGRSAAYAIFDRYLAYAEESEVGEVELFEHPFGIQPSVIARIPGQGSTANEIVILGGHEDSVSSTGQAPGADDDASGTAAVMEVFRVLSQAGFAPNRTIEFHAYAGEEAGLRGSQDIAAEYKKQQKKVVSMLQMDMIGYSDEESDPLGIVTDYTNSSLNAFVRELVDTYTSLTWMNTVCGYACSDHASWTKAGYPAAFPFETAFSSSNPYIHTKKDLLTYLSQPRMEQFVKLALAYVVEMA